MPDPSELPRGSYGSIPERYDQVSRFFQKEYPEEYTGYYKPRLPLLSKYIPLGNFEENYLYSNSITAVTVLEMIKWNQIDYAFDIQTAYENEILATMAKEAKFLENFNKQELRYTQESHVHEHMEVPQKKGWLRRK